MKKKKLISLLLSLLIICTMMMPGAMVYAVDSTTATETGTAGNGMVINKTATANDDGSYTVQLEAYATGRKVISQITKDVPTDIVLVLDQSGSMDYQMGKVYFSKYGSYTNESYYEHRHNGGDANLYYPVGNGSYASVSVTLKPGIEYNKISGWNNKTYYNNRNNLYAFVNGTYQKVTVDRDLDRGTYVYTYILDGKTIATGRSKNGSPVFSDSTISALYLMSANSSQNVYTYTYTDSDGGTQTIGTSTGADAKPVFKDSFYSKGYDETTGGKRIDALKTALTNFASAVSQKAAGEDGTLGTADDINHRIAVVGYAGTKYYKYDPFWGEYYYDCTYTNTELFVGSKEHGYGTEAQGQYGNAFQNMNTVAGQANITASIDALAANGGTHPEWGLEMANGILKKNPIAEGTKRNRVVIMFTDGVPGNSGFDTDVADNAIEEAQITKDGQTTVYSVGIFGGADATNAGDRNSSNETMQANWFMQTLSSNNGELQSPSYYLSAGDADSLNNIFKQISDNIESGGSSTTLNSTAVLRDVISTPFELPAGADESSITLKTYKYVGDDAAGTKQWTENSNAMDATASIDGDKVNVTGFDYAANYVGTDTNADGTKAYHGDKLVISFNVVPKDGFLGGNNVYTNTSAGVYENADAATPVLTFNRPQVNVPIKDITVTARDKNVYLLNDLMKEQLLSDATAKVGGIDLNLDPSVANYGLNPWQTEYVNISVAVKDQNCATVTDLNSLSDDQTYTLAVTVSPKTDGSNASGAPASAKTGSDSAKINVFKPELTFQDGTVYYGEAVPADFAANLTGTAWKHEGIQANTAAMGAAPALDLTYTVDAAKVADGKINSKKDVDVSAAVKIGTTDVTANTSFLHTIGKGDVNCGWNVTNPDGSPAFLLHIKTCDLTIHKTGGASNEPYVFTVYKDGKKYSEVTVVGNSAETLCELPVGTYTIAEDTNWSWRYSADNGGSASLSAADPTGSITCRNTKTTPNWFNGFSAVVKNIFGSAK